MHLPSVVSKVIILAAILLGNSRGRPTRFLDWSRRGALAAIAVRGQCSLGSAGRTGARPSWGCRRRNGFGFPLHRHGGRVSRQWLGYQQDTDTHRRRRSSDDLTFEVRLFIFCRFNWYSRERGQLLTTTCHLGVGLVHRAYLVWSNNCTGRREQTRQQCPPSWKSHHRSWKGEGGGEDVGSGGVQCQRGWNMNSPKSQP